MHRAMDDRVEPAEVAAKELRERVELAVAGRREVQGNGGRIAAPPGDDGVVGVGQAVGVAPEEGHGGAARGAGQGDGAAQAATGAGDEDDAAVQQVGGRPVVAGEGLGIHGFVREGVRSLAARSPLATAPSSVAG